MNTPAKSSQLLQETERLLAAGEMKRAVNKVLDIGDQWSFGEPEIKKSAIFISSRYRLTREKELKGLARYEDIDIAYNRLREQILTFIADIRALEAGKEPSQHMPLLSMSSYEQSRQAFVEQFQRNAERPEEAAISCRGVGLEKTYLGNSQFSLGPVDITLKAGEITSVIGENAAGKTTLLEILAGIITPDRGELTYPRLTSPSKDSWLHIKSQTGYIPQNLPKWSGKLRDNLHFIAAVRGIKGQANHLEVSWIIERLGLKEYENDYWNELSGGFKMRFSLAGIMVWKPKLVILDEPLAHLDINAQVRFLDDLQSIAHSATHPMAVIISSQHIHAVEQVCDNVLFFRKGNPIFNGPLTLLKKNPAESVFELEVDRNSDEVVPLLRGLPLKQIDIRGNTMVLTSDQYFSSTDLLRYLEEYHLRLLYFREITTSTKKLFS